MKKITKKYYNKIKNKVSYFLAFYFLDHLIDMNNGFKKLNLKFKKKTFIFILSGGVNKNRIDYLFNYLNENDYDFLFYSDYTDINRNVLKATFSSTYSSGELKHINILNFIVQNLELFSFYENFFFIDDDTFVNIGLLEKCFANNNFSQLNIYGQVLDKKSNPDNPLFSKFSELRYMSGGAGYIVPRKIFEKYTKFKNYFTGFSDSSFGLNIDKTILVDSKLFNSQDLEYYKIEKNDVSKYITFHYIKSEKLYNEYIKYSKELN
jgi:hypothetical protein